MTADVDFSRHMDAVARHLLGKPTKQTAKELRFGTRGSLSVDLTKGVFKDHETGEGGGVLDLIRREKGLSGSDAIAFLGTIGCAPTDAPSPRKNKGLGRIVATYDYVDESGNLLSQAVRFDPKDFRQRAPDGRGGWVTGENGHWTVKGVRPVPYRLAELSEAIGNERTVFICEGEKDCDALAQWGIAATTNAGGAGKWPAELSWHFVGADVVIIPDNDRQSTKPDGTLRHHPDGRPVFPGQDHAKAVAASLAGVAARVRILSLPGPVVKDASDWIAAGGTAIELWDLVETKAVPPEQFHVLSGAHGTVGQGVDGSLREQEEPPPPKLVLTTTEFLARYIAPDYLIDGLFQRGFFYSITGATGAGKTAIALLIAVLVAQRGEGRKFGDHDVEHGRVLYIVAENATDVRMRLMAMLERIRVTKEEIDKTLLFIETDGKNLKKDMPRIIAEAKAFGDIALVFVDTSAATFCGDDENSNTQMIAHAHNQRELTKLLPGRPAVVSLCHPIKNATTQDQLIPRGGGAFINETDGNFTVFSNGDRLSDFHWTGKLRGPDFEKITFKMMTVQSSLLVDSKGRPLPTVMARAMTEEEEADTERTLIFQENQMLKAMIEKPHGSLADWSTHLGWKGKSMAQRVVGRLIKAKLVAKDGRGFVMTKRGQEQAKASKGERDQAEDLP